MDLFKRNEISLLLSMRRFPIDCICPRHACLNRPEDARAPLDRARTIVVHTNFVFDFDDKYLRNSKRQTVDP